MAHKFWADDQGLRDGELFVYQTVNVVKGDDRFP